MKDSNHEIHRHTATDLEVRSAIKVQSECPQATPSRIPFWKRRRHSQKRHWTLGTLHLNFFFCTCRIPATQHLAFSLFFSLFSTFCAHFSMGYHARRLLPRSQSHRSWSCLAPPSPASSSYNRRHVDEAKGPSRASPRRGNWKHIPGP